MPNEQDLGRHPRDHRGPDDQGGEHRGDAHRHREPVDAVDAVADALRQQDVAAPADRGAQREAARRRSRRHPPTAGSAARRRPRRGPATTKRLPALAVQHGDAERAEELQRAGRAQRNPGDGRHEQQRDAPRSRRRGATHVRKVVLVKADGRGPDDEQQQHSGPRQPQPRGALDADLVDQAERQRQADLDAQHRRPSPSRRRSGPGSWSPLH